MIEKIEYDIENYEKELAELSKSMQEASQLQSGPRILSLSQAIHNCQSAIDRLFVELEELITGIGRIRDVEVDAAGIIYVALEHEDNGSVWRMTPQ